MQKEISKPILSWAKRCQKGQVYSIDGNLYITQQPPTHPILIPSTPNPPTPTPSTPPHAGSSFLPSYLVFHLGHWRTISFRQGWDSLLDEERYHITKGCAIWGCLYYIIGLIFTLLSRLVCFMSWENSKVSWSLLNDLAPLWLRIEHLPCI